MTSEQIEGFSEKSQSVNRRHDAAQPSYQRERKLWSFLTWSFFLAQYMAINGFLSEAAARAIEGLDLESETANNSVNSVNGANAAMEQGGEVSSEEASSAEADKAADIRSELPESEQKVAALEELTVNSMDALDDAAPANPLGSASPANPDNDGECGQPDCEDVVSLPPPCDQGADGGCTPPFASGPEIPILDPVGDIIDKVVDDVVSPILTPVGDIVNQVVDGVVAPILDPVGNLVNSVLDDVVSPILTPVASLVDTTVDAIVEPLLTPVDSILGTVTENVLAPVLDPVEDILETVANVAAPILNPIGNLAAASDSVLDPLLSPVLAPVESVIETAQPLVNPVLEPLADIAQTALAPAADAVSPVLDPVTQIVDATPLGTVTGGLFGMLGLSGQSPQQTDVIASGGSIPIPATQTAGGGDDLFQGSTYTHYNIALQNNLEDQNSSVGSNTSSPQSDSDTSYISADNDDPHVSSNSEGLGISALLNDLGLRTIGDGLFA